MDLQELGRLFAALGNTQEAAHALLLSPCPANMEKTHTSAPLGCAEARWPSVLIAGEDLHIRLVGERCKRLLNLLREDGRSHQVGRCVGEPVAGETPG